MKTHASHWSFGSVIGSAGTLLALMVLSTPQGLVAQECDLTLYNFEEQTQDSTFYFGLGEGNSRNRGLARRMAMARARGQLAISARADIVAFQEDAQQSLGEENEAIAQAFRIAIEDFTEARITNVRTEATTFCQEGGSWTFLVVVKMDQGNLVAEVVEEVQQEMENSIENGDAEYSRSETDAIFRQVDVMLEERRRRRGGQS